MGVGRMACAIAEHSMCHPGRPYGIEVAPVRDVLGLKAPAPLSRHVDGTHLPPRTLPLGFPRLTRLPQSEIARRLLLPFLARLPRQVPLALGDQLDVPTRPGLQFGVETPRRGVESQRVEVDGTRRSDVAVIR